MEGKQPCCGRLNVHSCGWKGHVKDLPTKPMCLLKLKPIRCVQGLVASAEGEEGEDMSSREDHVPIARNSDHHRLLSLELHLHIKINTNYHGLPKIPENISTNSELPKLKCCGRSRQII